MFTKKKRIRPKNCLFLCTFTPNWFEYTTHAHKHYPIFSFKKNAESFCVKLCLCPQKNGFFSSKKRRSVPLLCFQKSELMFYVIYVPECALSAERNQCKKKKKTQNINIEIQNVVLHIWRDCACVCVYVCACVQIHFNQICVCVCIKKI